ncbi:MAG: DUF3307 domain-containing protein [Aggregatilineales bacterium]
MLIPQLLFAHLLADYTLQTNWLVSRKNQWNGLALHGIMVFAMSIFVLAPYVSVMLIPVMFLTAAHMGQDWLKIHFGPRLKVHPIYPYAADQVGHCIQIGVIQLAVARLLIPGPRFADVLVAAIGASVVALTRFYDVTWWSNWMDMFPYMMRWRLLGYAERLAMFALSVIGLAFLAPLCAALRLFAAWRSGQPIWQQKRGTLEMTLGVGLAIMLGLIVRTLWLNH